MAFKITAEEINAVIQARGRANEPFHIAAAFYDQANIETDQDARAGWTLLGTAFNSRFDTANHRDPYSEPASSAITAANASELISIVGDIRIAAVRARLADLIWLRTRPITIGHLALESYCEAAQQAEDPKDWVYCARYAERSARLARIFKKLDHPVFAYLQTVAEKYQNGSSLFLTIESVRILSDLQPAMIGVLLPLLRHHAASMMSASNFYVARQAYDLIVTLGRRQQDRGIERDALIDVARSYEREAELKAQASAYGLAAGFYQSAIEAYQQAGSATADINRIRPHLADAEVKSLAELKRIGGTFDASGIAARAIKHVAGRSLADALLALVSVHPITDYDRLRETALEVARLRPATSMAARKILGMQGRTVGRSPGLTLGDTDENESAIAGQMSMNLLQTHRGGIIPCIILPALHQVNEEHDVTVHTLRDLVAYAPIVPPDRRALFLRGLAAGFDYDFMTATHFLIPQLENVLRLLLRSRDVPTTIFKDGTEIELDLGALLYEKRLEDILPKGLIFELQCFLVDRRAGNFRNQVAHGLFPDDAFETTDALYIWWLMLYLTLRLRPITPNTQPEPDEGAPPSDRPPTDAT